MNKMCFLFQSEFNFIFAASQNTQIPHFLQLTIFTFTCRGNKIISLIVQHVDILGLHMHFHNNFIASTLLLYMSLNHFIKIRYQKICAYRAKRQTQKTRIFNFHWKSICK